jgi:hypothetical protein
MIRKAGWFSWDKMGVTRSCGQDRIAFRGVWELTRSIFLGVLGLKATHLLGVFVWGGILGISLA